jgi:hypothetical protein
MNKQVIIEQIKNDWGSNPQSLICLKILNYLLQISNNSSFHITYGSLKRVAEIACNEKELLTAIQYLCGERTHLLEARFELVDKDDYFDISNSELKTARETGKLIHPENGEIVSDFEDKVVMYFQPSSLVKSISI